jgi:hypothetical protein
MVLEPSEVSVCLQHPGFDVDLGVVVDTGTLYRVYLGRAELAGAIRAGQLTLSGPWTLQRGFGHWFTWSAFAPASRSAQGRRTAASRLASPHRVRIAEFGDPGTAPQRPQLPRLDTGASTHLARAPLDSAYERVDDLSDILWGAMDEPLRDPHDFGRGAGRDELRTIVWPNGFDLDPNVLHGDFEPAPPPDRVARRGFRAEQNGLREPL